MIFSTTISRPLQLATRTLQWSSAVIVMGLTSYFIKHGPHGQHILYQEVIVRVFPTSFPHIPSTNKIHRPSYQLFSSSQHSSPRSSQQY